MGKNVLIVVDMQKDFVDGSLGTSEAAAIVDSVVKKVTMWDGEVIFTRDTHDAGYMESQEGKMLPVMHCVKDTDGWEIVPELDKIRKEKKMQCYDKPTFGCMELAENLRRAYEKGEIASVELVGLCTDICVVSNALLIKAYVPELPVSVDSSCCAGVTPKKHDAALETMRSCQIDVK